MGWGNRNGKDGCEEPWPPLSLLLSQEILCVIALILNLFTKSSLLPKCKG